MRAALAAAALTSACSSTRTVFDEPDAADVPDAAPVVACDNSTQNQLCFAKTGDIECAQFGGGARADGCPTSNLVGCCHREYFEQCYYGPRYASATDAQNARENCEVLNDGTWAERP